MITRNRLNVLIKESVENSLVGYIADDPVIKSSLANMMSKKDFFRNMCNESPLSNKETISNWINQNLKPDSMTEDDVRAGSGASRFTFHLGDNDEFVIKIAHDFDTGIYTNMKEIQEFINYGNLLSIFPRMYLGDKNSFEWLVLERVDVPSSRNAEAELGEVIKSDYPEVFSNFALWLSQNLPEGLNTSDHIKILIEDVPYNTVFMHMPTGLEGGTPAEYFYFLMFLYCYPFDGVSTDILVDGLIGSDPFMMFAKAGFREEYEALIKHIIERMAENISLRQLANVIYNLGVDVLDLGVGNLGSSRIDGSLKIIDISIFEGEPF